MASIQDPWATLQSVVSAAQQPSAPSQSKVEVNNPTGTLVAAGVVESHTEFINERDMLGYLRLLFEPGDWIDIQLIHQTETKPDGKGKITRANFITLENALLPETVGEIVKAQSEGWNAYIAMNAYTPGVERRRKQDVKAIRAVYAEIDQDGKTALAKIEADIAAGLVPDPHFILESSPGKFYVIWRVKDFTLEQQEGLNTALQVRCGSDPACTDASRVLRLPGTQNLKDVSKPFVEIIDQVTYQTTEDRYSPADFKLDYEIKAHQVDYSAAPEKVQLRVSCYEQACEDAGIDPGYVKEWEGGYLYEVECPNYEQHTGMVKAGGSVRIHASGRISYGCFHGHCKGKGWADFYRPWMREQAKMNGFNGVLKFGDADEVPPNILVGGVNPADKKSEADINSGWPDPQPVEDSLLPVAQFSLDFLPASIRLWVQDVSERMQVPLDFTGICALVVLAGATNRRAFMYPKEHDKEWKEALAISGAVVASSGSAKTPTWKTFTSMLEDVEKDWSKDHSKVVATYLQKKASWDETQKALKKAAKDSRVKDSSQKSSEDFIVDEGEGILSFDKPEEPEEARRLMINDSTPEKMQDLMEKNPSGLFVYRDEMSGWAAELDKPGREQARELYLAAMNGNDWYIVDRIERGSVGAMMSASMFGGFQPSLFKDFLSNSRNVSDGTIPRLGLLVWPDVSKMPYVDRGVNDEAKKRFSRIVKTLANLAPESVSLHFSPEAQRRFNGWLQDHQARVKTEPDTGKQSHLAKYQGLLPKLAGLLQLADIVSAAPVVVGCHLVDLEHLDRALSLLAYLETHMLRVYKSIRTPEQKAVCALAQHLAAGDLDDGFTIRDITNRREWAALKDRYVVDSALETLEELGWVRLYPKAQKQSKVGRPTDRWAINPKPKKIL
jgi:hypothetical protein